MCILPGQYALSKFRVCLEPGRKLDCLVRNGEVMTMIYRKATFADVENMRKLINDYADAGLMLGRSSNVF